MYEAALRERSIPLFNRPVTVRCRAKLSATHQHLEIKTPQPILQRPAVGVRQLNHYGETPQTGLLVRRRTGKDR